MEKIDLEINNILAAITFTEYSIPAIYHASFLCYKLNASLHILNVVNQRDIEAAAMYTRLIGSTPVNVEEYKKVLIQSRKDKVNEILQEKNLSHITSEIVINIGDPAEEILKFINENNIDLGVLAKSGREKEGQFLAKTGSVADKVFRNSSIPILFIDSE